MQGTPFIYQGQEIGMTNVNYATIDEYDDVATKNLYKIRSEAGIPHEKIMKVIWASSRDNSRTPMQWSDDIHAGFTTGTPWIGVNPNYREINVEKQQKDPHSVYHFYKKMIALKKENKIFTYGTYDLILENDPQIFAYTRTLSNKRVLVLTNLSDQSVKYVHDNILLKYDNLILNNYEVEKHEITNQCLLKPYEARVYWI